MKMLKLLILICGLIFCVSGKCQATHIQTKNAYITAGAYSIHFLDAFSFGSNPACLSGIKTFSAGVLTERKWMLKELDNYEIATTYTLGKDGLGISIQQSGDADYNELGLDMAYGKNLGRLELGIRFVYLADRAAGYHENSFGTSGIGIRFHVSDKLITGWELGLPVFGTAGKIYPERAPQFFRMGFGYEWSPNLFMALQIEKISGTPVNVIPSLEYRYGEQFFFSFGINSREGEPYFKSGWKKNRLAIQLYILYEPVLGLSPGLVLLWEGKNKKG